MQCAAHVIVSGGLAAMIGWTARLEQELRMLLPPELAAVVHVEQANSSHWNVAWSDSTNLHRVWRGAGNLTSAESFNGWVTKAMVSEFGAEAVCTRFL